MSTLETVENLQSRILSNYALLFLKTWEEERWETELSALALEIERGLVVWSVTEGPKPPPSRTEADLNNPRIFLEHIPAYPDDHVFLLKDFHPYLNDPEIVRTLRDLSDTLAAHNKTLMFMGPVNDIPIELGKEAVSVDLPLPGMEELRDELAAVLKEQKQQAGRAVAVSGKEEETLVKAVLGLTTREAHKALSRALWGRETVDDDVYKLLVSEKKVMVQGSDLLEFYELDEGVKDVGGLDNLKEWVAQRGEAFSTKAQEQGIPAPKGVLLLGVQGCGKSLTARATARLLNFPLVRLDVANLLDSEQGSSEKNMRDVLRLMETIAPAVLWLDEIEKGFAGGAGEGVQDATMSRLIGGFLTWMEERRAPIFVVATANSVTGLPPEMLRRGRFDELFFIDLPSYHERMDIFSIHLSKRNWKPEKYDLRLLSEKSESFSGAEIEQIVVSAMIDAYGQGRVLSQKDLEDAAENTVPLSVTMEEKVFQLREWARPRCRPATPDSHVMQMIEQEERLGALDVEQDDSKEEWLELAEHGQLNTAVVEFIRHRDFVTFPELQETFADFMETDGEQGLALRSDPNIVLWVGMSKELAELLSKLIAAKRLYVHPTDPDRYDADGMKLQMLEEMPEDRISRPAWFPTCLRDLPPEEGSGRFARVARMKLSK